MFPKKFPVLFTDSSGNNYQPEIFSCEYKICWEVPLWSQKQFTHLTTIELLVPLDITLNIEIDFHNQTYKDYIPETAYPL